MTNRLIKALKNASSEAGRQRNAEIELRKFSTTRFNFKEPIDKLINNFLKCPEYLIPKQSISSEAGDQLLDEIFLRKSIVVKGRNAN